MPTPQSHITIPHPSRPPTAHALHVKLASVEYTCSMDAHLTVVLLQARVRVSVSEQLIWYISCEVTLVLHNYLPSFLLMPRVMPTTSYSHHPAPQHPWHASLHRAHQPSPCRRLRPRPPSTPISPRPHLQLHTRARAAMRAETRAPKPAPWQRGRASRSGQGQ